MTMAMIDPKIRPEHLQRRAFVYIRQSSPQQLRDHAEGRRRQFQMADWAEQIGWPKERIVVIDEEGKTASVAGARTRFGDLITAVGRGEAGVVISLEARSRRRRRGRLRRRSRGTALTEK
jgi:DNA invertase Pin-like site-specific DNA recombinase